MTLEIKHAFTSLKGDGGDATLVKPSDWNAAHTTSMATGKLLGRLTNGVGSIEEISVSALVAAALDETSGLAFLEALGVGGFETGDVKFSLVYNGPVANGWLTYSGEGTIGKAGSGATVYAAAEAQALYVILYDNVNDTYAPVSGGRTGVAINDFNSGKTIGLPRFSGRSVIGVGTGSGLTARNNGWYGGAETHQLTLTELPSGINSSVTVNVAGGKQVATYLSGAVTSVATTGTPVVAYDLGGGANLTFVTSFSGSGASNNTGNGSASPGSAAHSNMSPYVTLWVKIKL